MNLSLKAVWIASIATGLILFLSSLTNVFDSLAVMDYDVFVGWFGLLGSSLFTILLAVLTFGLFKRKEWSFNLGRITTVAGGLYAGVLYLLPVPQEIYALYPQSQFNPHVWFLFTLAVMSFNVFLGTLIYFQRKHLTA